MESIYYAAENTHFSRGVHVGVHEVTLLHFWKGHTHVMPDNFSRVSLLKETHTSFLKNTSRLDRWDHNDFG